MNFRLQGKRRRRFTAVAIKLTQLCNKINNHKSVHTE